jgi:hypothetical protein
MSPEAPSGLQCAAVYPGLSPSAVVWLIVQMISSIVLMYQTVHQHDLFRWGY